MNWYLIWIHFIFSFWISFWLQACKKLCPTSKVRLQVQVNTPNQQKYTLSKTTTVFTSVFHSFLYCGLSNLMIEFFRHHIKPTVSKQWWNLTQYKVTNLMPNIHPQNVKQKITTLLCYNFATLILGRIISFYWRKKIQFLSNWQ